MSEGKTTKNIEIQTMPDGRLAFIVDPKQDFGTSSTGKSITIASSGGFYDLPGQDGVFLSMTVGKIIPKSERAKKVA